MNVYIHKNAKSLHYRVFGNKKADYGQFLGKIAKTAKKNKKSTSEFSEKVINGFSFRKSNKRILKKAVTNGQTI